MENPKGKPAKGIGCTATAAYHRDIKKEEEINWLTRTEKKNLAGGGGQPTQQQKERQT